MLQQGPRGRRTTGGLDLQACPKVTEFYWLQAFLVLSLVFLILASVKVANADQAVPGDHISSYLSAAEAGDKKAQYLLGLRYERGVSGVPDFKAAAQWYSKAAEQGMRLASFRVALIYHHGRGLTQNYAAAARWYSSAAEAGLAEAQYNLGYLYEHGLGVMENGSQAVAWYRRAALQGISESYKSLGMLFTKDGLVERSDAKALFWLSLSEDDAQAQKIIQFLRKRGGDAAVQAAQKMRDEWSAHQR